MWLTIESGPARGTRVEITGERFVLGREQTCDLVIDESKVSREHAVVETRAGTSVLRDLDSANGTYVDGRRIREPITLRGGERIRVGETEISASLTEGALATVFEPAPAQPAKAPPPAPPPAPASYGRGAGGRRSRGRPIAALAVLAAVIVVVALFATDVFGGNDRSAAEVIADTRASTVFVRSLQGGQSQGSGSGWVFDAERSLVVTNYHVVAPGREFRVGTLDGERDADLVAAAPCDDLAVLRVEDATGLRTLPIGSADQVDQGDEVIALGFPGNTSLAEELQTSSGSVSATNSTIRVPDPQFPVLRGLVQTDAAINPGNSGGPLVNLDGELVGVNFAATGGESQGLAIGIERVEDALGDLAEGRSRGWTGMSIRFDARQLGALDLPSGPLVVVDVVPGTAAADAGFGMGDLRLITAIENQPIDDGIRSYCGAVAGLQSGDLGRFSFVSFAPTGERQAAATTRVQFE